MEDTPDNQQPVRSFGISKLRLMAGGSNACAICGSPITRGSAYPNNHLCADHSVLAANVDPDPGLFEELNSINAAAAHVKVLWASGAVMAEGDLVAEALELAEPGNALHVVRNTAERYNDVLSAYFGASTEELETDQ